jgi:hypothetical protein
VALNELKQIIKAHFEKYEDGDEILRLVKLLDNYLSQSKKYEFLTDRSFNFKKFLFKVKVIIQQLVAKWTLEDFEEIQQPQPNTPKQDYQTRGQKKRGETPTIAAVAVKKRDRSRSLEAVSNLKRIEEEEEARRNNKAKRGAGEERKGQEREGGGQKGPRGEGERREWRETGEESRGRGQETGNDHWRGQGL